MVRKNNSVKVIQSKEINVDNKKLQATEYDITTRRGKINGELETLKIKEFVFKSTDKKLTIKDVTKIINDKSKGLKDKGFKGYISSNIDTPFGWKSSRIKPVGYQITNSFQTWGTNYVEIEEQFKDNNNQANIETYYENDQSIVEEFRIFLYDFPDEAGCNGKFNDCVYDALKKAFGEHIIWDTPIHFKKFIDVERHAKVPIQSIDKIESKLKTAINIEGDHTRASTLNTKRQINLIWTDGHVELKRTNTPIKSKSVKYEKKPLVYYQDRTDKEHPTFHVYDGEKEFKMEKEEFNKHSRYEYKTSPYITIPKTPKKTMKETYDYFMNAHNKLKEQTKKHLAHINLCKTGTFKDTALKLFNDLNVSLPEPESITQMESEWILNCYRGGMLYSQNGYEGELYSSDIKAMYPYHMQSNLNFPIKQGQFKKITDDDIEKFFSYGIYRAAVKQTTQSQNIVFHFNPENYYTHLDLTRARELKLKIELIQDEKPNFLYYSPDTRIEGRQLFKPFIDYLIQLETPDIKDAVKSIRNVLWGALCEVLTYTKYPNEEGDVILNFDEHIVEMKTTRYGTSFPVVVKQTQQFKTNYARLAPFLTSTGRYQISKYITDNFSDINDVKRIHTDSIYTPKDVSKVFIRKDDKSAKIGTMLYTGYNPNVKIINLNTFSNDNFTL